MKLDFTPIKDKLPEGLTVEMLALPAIQDFIGTFTTSSVDTATQGLKATNLELKNEKTALKEDLDKKKDIDPAKYASLLELEKNDINLDEYAQLKQFKEDNTDAAGKIQSLQQQISSIETAHAARLEEIESEKAQLNNGLLDERRSNQIANGIQDHASKYNAVGLLPGNAKWVQQEASDVWKYQEGGEGEKGRFVAMDGDQMIPGADGKPIGMGEWVNTLRDKPEFMHMFAKPEGGGAGGGAAGGMAVDKTKLVGSKAEAASAVAGMFPDLPAS